MRYIIACLLLANIAYFSWLKLGSGSAPSSTEIAADAPASRPLLNTGLSKVNEAGPRGR